MKIGTSVVATLVIAVFCLAAQAQIASGGTYTLNQSVIGNGGGTSTGGGTYRVDGTAGQSVAGTNSTGGNYSALGGFWAANAFVPTAAGVTVGGKVLGTEGQGLRNVMVMISGGSLMRPRTTRTNGFGNFSFDNIDAGQVYVISVITKKYGFGVDTQVISVIDNALDVNFQANWEN